MTNEKALILVNERIKGIEFFKDVEPWKDQYAMWLIVKEALEKQIPKKPNITSMKLIGGEVLTHYSVCPECGDALTIGYPCKCGQLIDWEW